MSKKRIKFTKMQGIGNDYIYINCFEQRIDNPEQLSRLMSPRRHSVGSDGVVLICPSDCADAKMRIFNADGSEAKMCGNGVRCVGKYLYDSGIARKDTVTVDTLSGIKILNVTEKNGVAVSLTVDMGAPELVPEKIPVRFDSSVMISEPVCIGDDVYSLTAVSMGNPHAVVFCDEPDDIPLETLGPEFEHSPLFPEQVNTEFVSVLDRKTLKMRVWERGSGETLACGTGACAAVCAAVLNGLCERDSEITVKLRGGDLWITYAADSHIYMRGGAEKVYDGVYEYES